MGSQRGARTLAALSHYFGRGNALWKPVAAEEAFEIVRRRLFEKIRDQAAADAACRAFADLYLASPDDFPAEVRKSRYLERLQRAYPIHPEISDRLYTDWSSLKNFLRTRGVLKLMAKVIHRLWKDNDKDPFIMPGSCRFMMRIPATRQFIIMIPMISWIKPLRSDFPANHRGVLLSYSSSRLDYYFFSTHGSDDMDTVISRCLLLRIHSSEAHQSASNVFFLGRNRP